MDKFRNEKVRKRTGIARELTSRADGSERIEMV